MHSKTILITDGNTELGINLIEKFIEKNVRVKALYLGQHEELSDVEWIHGSLDDPISYDPYLAGVDVILHNTSLLAFRKEDHKKLQKINTLATRELVNNALYSGVAGLVYLSSAYTLLRTGIPDLIKTGAEGNPVFLNEWTKTLYQAELEIYRAEAEGMKVCILNSPLVFNPGKSNESKPVNQSWLYEFYKFVILQKIPWISTQVMSNAIVDIFEKDQWGDQILISDEFCFNREDKIDSSQYDLNSRTRTLSLSEKLNSINLIQEFRHFINWEHPWLNPAASKIFEPTFKWERHSDH
ncbi:MAG: SDR family oxidoreductase [Saprospiraceae bacterium]|nr:SDR family oxidoreductase [Saprospiraceae bacterium]